jgi:phosphate transport system ATP-binding protein
MIATNPDLTSAPASTKLETRDVDVYYGNFHAIKDANLSVPEHCVMALIGPSGCGKSTFLRALNRMHDLTPDARVDGHVLLDGEDIYASNIDPVTVRHRIGMVFQRPNPFPKTIFENVVYGPKIHGERNRKTLMDICEKGLRGAALCQGPTGSFSARALGGSTATPLHCALPRRRSGSDLDGRAGIRARPDRNEQDRRPHR